MNTRRNKLRKSLIKMMARQNKTLRLKVKDQEKTIKKLEGLRYSSPDLAGTRFNGKPIEETDPEDIILIYRTTIKGHQQTIDELRAELNDQQTLTKKWKAYFKGIR